MTSSTMTRPTSTSTIPLVHNLNPSKPDDDAALERIRAILDEADLPCAAPGEVGLTGYARISQDGDGRALGVERQVRDIVRLAKLIGTPVAMVVVENDMSGSEYATKPRDLWAGVVERMRTGISPHVLASSTSRLTRDVGDMHELLKLRRRGAAFTTQQGARMHPEMGAFEVSVIRNAANQDALESDLISQRTRDQSVQLASYGQPHGPIAYGWDRHRERNGLVVETINEAQADVLREVARRMIAGEATNEIVRDLNAREIRAPRGGQWSAAILNNLMLRERNVARRVHQGSVVETKLPGGRAAWQPLYDDDTHAAVVAHLRDPRRRSNRGARRHLLSGLLTCGKCLSRRVYVLTSSTGKPGYACSDCHGIRREKEPVETRVVAALCARLARPDALDWQAQDRSSLDAARARVATLRGKLAERVDMFDREEMGRDEYVRSSTRLRAEIAEAEAAVEVARPLPGAVRALVGHGTAKATRRAWDLLSLDQQKLAIGALLTITVLPARGRTFDESVRLDWFGES